MVTCSKCKKQITGGSVCLCSSCGNVVCDKCAAKGYHLCGKCSNELKNTH